MSISSLLLDRIKQSLQTKRVTYREVAAQLSVAESTVKRWFSTGQLSLSQLDQLCDLLGLSIDELIKTADENRMREVFDRKHEEFFAANEKALVIFYLLSAGLKPRKILDSYGFEEAELNRVLLQLDKNGLIELGIGDRIRLLKKIDTLWNPLGPLSQKYYPLIKSDFISSDFSKEHEAHWFFSGALTAATQKIIVKKINALAIEIKNYYRLDEGEKEAKNITMFFGLRPWTLPLISKYRRKA